MFDCCVLGLLADLKVLDLSAGAQVGGRKQLVLEISIRQS